MTSKSTMLALRLETHHHTIDVVEAGFVAEVEMAQGGVPEEQGRFTPGI
jgi:hypothetical protein